MDISVQTSCLEDGYIYIIKNLMKIHWQYRSWRTNNRLKYIVNIRNKVCELGSNP